ncbi:GNAT family N-acetyltransferase [Clostridium sp. SHJSY1]|uniref:GNAT family N-acetyltransferase n=1 Tax=Clostridium sp. SHJSY1 TaxID=2942483 RepID=UPI0028757CF6|nr:GNAT family protein [Clostridium sp. SHJSY1]MDS0527276.1 GNAT family N-acetyltransferase [Clostridium sp. SHJSY1]
MLQEQCVSIAGSLDNKQDYVIRDKNKINIGRFTIIDLDEENKKCSIKLKFYRDDDYELLKETLNLILKAIFKDISINKVNVYVADTIMTSVFLDLGFTLEGVFFDNIYYQGEYHNEIAMGITRIDYNVGKRNNLAELYSQNIMIKLLTPEDAEVLLKYCIDNREHLRTFEPMRDNGYYTLEAQREILSESYRQFLTGTTVDFGIFKNERLIGKLKISNIVNGIFKSATIGYSIDKNEQGNGYMKETVKLAIKYAFEELQLHRLEASALVENTKSQNVLKACGFKELGINEQYLFINGKWRDHITYYITSKHMKGMG